MRTYGQKKVRIYGSTHLREKVRETAKKMRTDKKVRTDSRASRTTLYI